MIKDYLTGAGFIERFSKGQDRLPPTLALISVVLLAAWMGNANGGYFVNDWAPPALILAALLLFVSIVGFFRNAKLSLSFLALGLLAAYTAWTFASLLWSPNKGDAWLGAGQTLLYLLVFWVTVAFVALGASRRWVLVASVLGPGVVAAFTLSVLQYRLDAFFENDRLVGTAGYYNGEAAFLLIPFWVAVYLGGSRHVNPLLRGAVLASAVLCLDLAVLTQSRGAMVAMAASLPIFFLFSGRRLRGLISLVPLGAALFVAFPELNQVYLAFLNMGNPIAALELALPTVWVTALGAGMYGLAWGLIDWRWRPPKLAVQIVGGLVLVGVVVAILAGASVLNNRVGDVETLAERKWEAFKSNDMTGEDQSRYLSASGRGRYELWRIAWEDFSKHPVLGIGTQNYEATYYNLREQYVGSVRQPHSLQLEVLAERGIIGGALFFGFVALCVGSGLWSRFSNLSREGKAQVGALVAAVTYWFVHSSAEWFWQMPAITLVAFVYLALLISPWRRGEISLETTHWPLRAAGVGVAMLTLAVVVPLYVANHYQERSYTAPNPAEALVAVERAQEFNPFNPRLPQREAELAMEVGDWTQAEAAYKRAIRLNPEHYEPHMLLATFYDRRVDLPQALHHYQEALTLNPLDTDLKKRVRELQQQL